MRSAYSVTGESPQHPGNVPVGHTPGISGMATGRGNATEQPSIMLTRTLPRSLHPDPVPPTPLAPGTRCDRFRFVVAILKRGEPDWCGGDGQWHVATLRSDVYLSLFVPTCNSSHVVYVLLPAQGYLDKPDLLYVACAAWSQTLELCARLVHAHPLWSLMAEICFID